MQLRGNYPPCHSLMTCTSSFFSAVRLPLPSTCHFFSPPPLHMHARQKRCHLQIQALVVFLFHRPLGCPVTTMRTRINIQCGAGLRNQEPIALERVPKPGHLLQLTMRHLIWSWRLPIHPKWPCSLDSSRKWHCSIQYVKVQFLIFYIGFHLENTHLQIWPGDIKTYNKHQLGE